MPITHAKVSGVADGPDTAQVRPSDWNAAHVGGVVLGAPTTRTVAAGVINVAGLHYVIVNGEGAADDILQYMTGGVDGQQVVLEQGNATVTLARGGGPPNGLSYLNQERTDDFQLGNFTTFVHATYSATQGVWLVEGDYVGNSIMSGSGDTEIIATDAYGLTFHVNAIKAMQITEASGAGKIGFFSKADETLTIAQPTVTGSRGGNAALASLLTQLAALGLIIDGTS